MAFQIDWTDEAREDVRATTSYLLDHFGETAADRFADRLAAALKRLEAMPSLGKRHSELNAVHQLVIAPNTVLCYVVMRGMVIITNVLN